MAEFDTTFNNEMNVIWRHIFLNQFRLLKHICNSIDLHYSKAKPKVSFSSSEINMHAIRNYIFNVNHMKIII
jgi:hypothetical protein